MQLVPILSTIILVGTIATFILAVAAYILYKIRERKAREAPARPTAPEPHVLVAPQVVAGAPAPAAVYTEPAAQPLPPGQPLQTAEPEGSLFWEYTDEGFVPAGAARPQKPAPKPATDEDNGFAWL